MNNPQDLLNMTVGQEASAEAPPSPSAPDTPVTVSDLPDPTTLDSDTRIKLIQKFRAKIKGGEQLTLEEATYAIGLLRQERTSATSTSSSKKTKASTPAGPPVGLDYF